MVCTQEELRSSKSDEKELRILAERIYDLDTRVYENTGTSIHSDHRIYPKNDGIWIPFSSEIAFTIKLGAFPIYVFAPINTAPQEIAVSIPTGIFPRVVAIPCA